MWDSSDWHCTKDSLLYASELRALLEFPGFDWRLSRENFVRFLANSYYGGTDSPIDGIFKLMPGTILEWDGTMPRLSTYWTSVPGEHGAKWYGTDNDALDEFESLLDLACARSMRSDVPYGVFLSGGIDSSLVLDFCQRTNPDVASFAVAMSERDFDESSKSDVMQKYLDVRSHRRFTLTEESVVDAMREVLDHMDEPHGDPGLVNAHFLSQSVRPHITVGIAGDGGDELFAGYALFKAVPAARILSRVPAVVPLLKAGLRLLPSSDTYMSLHFKVRAFLQGFPATDALRLPQWLASTDLPSLAELCTNIDPKRIHEPGFKKGIYADYASLDAELGPSTDIQKCLHFYQRIFLPEFVCMHTDRAAMLNSLEVRAPLLSPSLIEFANKLPDRMKMRGSRLKWLMSALARRRGYPDLITEQRKQGFTFPIARWLKTSLSPMTQQLVLDPEWEDDRLVAPDVVQALYEQHMSGSANHYRTLYNLTVFRAWRRKFPNVAPPA
ncbi:MAG: hypothetical protein GKR94_04435 [Gammaproteobacteria bacterium]|nr:hypothetical protein [Gammaproteobacteria bacterium]